MPKLLFSRDHEWISFTDGEATVGITDHAQNSLGDIVFVELPGVDEEFDTGDIFGSIESVKSVSDLYMPVKGQIQEVNKELGDNPALINEDPYEDGWMVIIKCDENDLPDDLMEAEEYEEFVKSLD